MANSGEEQLVLLYVPCGSEEEARRIATSLLDQRLIACGNIYRSTSLYRWEGALADEVEHLLLCKTLARLADAAQEEVERLHSYQIPCIVHLQPAGANQAYVEWVAGEVRDAPMFADREVRDTR